MNTYSIAPMTNDEWIVDLLDAVDDVPQVECDFVTPYIMGELDAGDNEPCAPEVYFANIKDRINYCLGYISAWPTEIARLTLRYYEDKDYGSIEDDSEFNRRGC